MRTTPYALQVVKLEISRFPYKERLCMPGSLTAPGRQGTRDNAPRRAAFRVWKRVGTRNMSLSRLNGWPTHSPVNASPTPSRAPAHDSGPMRLATPSSQWTLTTYSLPVSRRTPKDFIPIKASRSYSISNGLFALTLPADLRCAPHARQNGRLLIAFRGELRYSGENRRAELVYDNADRIWRVRVSTEVGGKRMPEDSCRPQGRAAAIDLGLRISASLTIEGQGTAHHFAGRELMKDYQYWTRRIAAHQQELAGRRLYASRRLNRLYVTRGRRLEHGLRSIAKGIAGLCRASGVKVVYIGWPKGIRDDVKVCRDWRGRIHNYWSFGIFSGYITGALTKHRIVSRRVGERGTSSTCPWTLNTEHTVVRRPRWKLSCKDCDKSMHSDAAGSANILAFQKPGTDRDGVKATPALRTHEWNKHSWAMRANRRATARRLAA